MKAKWYIVQVYSGFEEKVAEAIRADSSKEGLSDQIEEIFIPKENAKQVKNGSVDYVERKIHQGYLYVKMIFSEKLYSLIKNVNKVSGFLGGNKSSKSGVSEPLSVSEREISAIKQLLDVKSEEKALSSFYGVGDRVQVLEGPFQSFTGLIQEVDDLKARLKVAISIFNRETLIDLNSDQIKKT